MATAWNHKKLAHLALMMASLPSISMQKFRPE
jgi:hypothetical protein